MIAQPKIAIQGALGSNSHMAARRMLPLAEIRPCISSGEVIDRLLSGEADGAVLPIENSLHGSVAEHNDLLLRHPLRLTRESLLRIRHNVIVVPGVRFGELTRVLSHPVALSQCRVWLAAHPDLQPMPSYDTAGSVQHLMQTGSRTEAAIAPELAATIYGAEILVHGVEDHRQNLTRFHLIVRDAPNADPFALSTPPGTANKMSLAFAIEHQPGTLVRALDALAEAGVNLSKIESRPVPGSPWQYVFHLDLRFDGEEQADRAIALLRPRTSMLKELGRYQAAETATDITPELPS